MSTMELDDLRWALHDYLMGHAQSDQARMRALTDRPWRQAARLELLQRRTALVRAFDDQVLGAVAAGVLDVAAEAKQLTMRLEEMDADSAAEAVASERSTASAGVAPDAPPAVIALMTAAVDEVAARHLDGQALTPALMAALGEAFVAGWHAAA